MTYRPGRYRAGGRHEDEEEVNRRRALRYGGQGRKKEEVRTDFDLDFGERRKRTSWRSSERREIRESRIGKYVIICSKQGKGEAKKKVHVETTVVSDAIALSSRYVAVKQSVEAERGAHG